MFVEVRLYKEYLIFFFPVNVTTEANHHSIIKRDKNSPRTVHRTSNSADLASVFNFFSVFTLNEVEKEYIK